MRSCMPCWLRRRRSTRRSSACSATPPTYGRFGFRPASAVGIEPQNPSWSDHFPIRILGRFGDQPTGRFRYAEPFDAL
ncbi:hypothetical protein BH23ACT10_BH23ACT10_12360 [soil metagenome]